MDEHAVLIQVLREIEALAGRAALNYSSELDRWFPRGLQPAPEPENLPDDGVFPGVERPRKKRYGRRWYQIRHREMKTEQGHTGGNLAGGGHDEG
jgi:hypothetical protein